MKKSVLTALAAILVFGGFAFAGSNDRLFTVEADAIVRVKPDRVVFDVGVLTRSTDLMEAKKKNSAAIAKAIDYCKKAGIAEKNIKTDYVNIRPEWRNYEKFEVSYVVEQNLSIILEDVSKYDEVVTELLKSGMNQVRYIDFQTTELKTHRNGARKLAMQAAKERAALLAEEAGIKLGKIVNVSDRSINWFPLGRGLYANQLSQNISHDTGGNVTDAADAFAPGMVSVKSQIVLTYEIK